jgi:intracellular sulfur oxidation DsrE/DsrF family protein
MIKTFTRGAALALCLAATPAVSADTRYPVVQGYGAIMPMPHVKERPDQQLRYRVLFNVTKAAPATDRPNPSLEKVARFLNLLGADGVRPAAGDVVVIVHGPATPLVLGDAAYADRNKVDRNPNVILISALRAAGVSVRVCSQALAGNHIAVADVASGVETDVSALTTLATLQLRGWALIPD